MKKNIVISFLGTTLDNHGRGQKRWDGWRPSVALAMQDDIVFDEFHMIHAARDEKLAHEVTADIRAVSPGTTVIPQLVSLDDPWDFETVYAALYDLSRRLQCKPDEHNYYVHITTGTHVAQICLFLLTESRHFPGVLIQTSPAGRKPSGAKGRYTTVDLDLSKYDLLAKRFEQERRDDVAFLKSGIGTRSRAFNALIDTIERVTLKSAEPLLLTGPSGAGKSRLARRIYELRKLSGRIAGDFVEVNCATLRGDMAMAALFGHVKGAFTGAAAARPGLLKSADGGMLFLDEIGELGLDEQAMLLRAIEEKTFLPVGADKETHSDFRLVCGTNKNLAELAARDRFRYDLLARINLWHFDLPGLAARREDIAPNLDYELERFREKTGRRVTFNKEACARFLKYATSPATQWRGNFREFNAMLTRMATLAPDGRIDTATVAAEIRRVAESGEHGTAPAAAAPSDALLAALLGADYAAKFDRFELAQFIDVVRVVKDTGTLSEAGRILFAATRAQKKTANDTDRLRKYLLRFGITWHDIKNA